MGAVEGMLQILGAVGNDNLRIHEQRCICVRDRNADCLRCAEACTSEAIEYIDGNLEVHPERCIGCGTCATACPTCAIELRRPTDADLMGMVKDSIRRTQGHPVFACERALDVAEERAAADGAKAEAPYDPRKMVITPCLGRIDEAVITGCAAYGCYDTTLVCHDCESCEHVSGGRLIRTVVESSRNLLDAFGSSMPIDIVEELPERVCETERTGMSGEERRKMFSQMKQEAQQAAGFALDATLAGGETHEPTLPKVGTSGHMPQFVPERRTRTFNYLKHLGEPVSPTITSRIIGAVEIDPDACDSCRMCATFCPTGAIERVDEEGFFGIYHRPTLCVQCRLCESVCRRDAIHVDSTVSAERFVGHKALAIRMPKPEWVPNTPDSLFDKIHEVIGSDIPMIKF